MNTDELLAQFRADTPLADDAAATQAYARATRERRRITAGRAVALGLALACLTGAGTAVAYTVTRSPSHRAPSGGEHGRDNGGTSTTPTGTSANCGIEPQTTPVPPPGFDPVTASQAELREYGFPPRPSATDPTFQSWLQAMKAYKTTDTAEPTCGVESHPSASHGRR